MAKYHPENERIKAKYFDYEKQANGKSEKTIENSRKALIRLEEFTEHKSFKTFSHKQATAFKGHLLKAKNQHGQPLSASTIAHTLYPLKDFFKWLAMQQGYRASIKFPDIEFLNLTEKDRHLLRSNTVKEYPSPEQLRKVLALLPATTDVQKRDRAILAFLFATGARDGALVTLKLKHLNVEKKYVQQNPKEVATKFGKHINTRFYPVGEDIHQIIAEWVTHLREVLLFGDNDPLFPKEMLVQGEDMSFKGGTLSREHWQSTSAVCRILKASFEAAGLPYYSPHRIRDTLSAIGRKVCKTVEEQMAWARNMGHESPSTTFMVYGGFSVAQQFEVIERLGREEEKAATSPDASEIAKEVAKLLKQG